MFRIEVYIMNPKATSQDEKDLAEKFMEKFH